MEPDFPTLLRTYRKGMGWSQEQLAQRWSYSFETISAWERGKRKPSSQEIPRLARLLEVETEALARIIASQRQPGNAVADSSLEGQVFQPQRRSSFEVWGELRHIYRTRTEFNQAFSYAQMFQWAHSILAVGISLNAIALTYSRESLLRLIRERQCLIQLCFLDPQGKKCAEREQEEGHPEGILANLTGVNIYLMQTLREQLLQTMAEAAKYLEIRVYDLIPRFNIYIVNDRIMTVQSYAYGRGEDTPTLVLERKVQDGLFDFYAAAARHVLAHSTAIGAGSAASPERES
jgi:transcriptional regulator with XRE-family HTH domain